MTRATDRVKDTQATVYGLESWGGGVFLVKKKRIVGPWLEESCQHVANCSLSFKMNNGHSTVSCESLRPEGVTQISVSHCVPSP